MNAAPLRRLQGLALIALGVVVFALPAPARIARSRPSASSTWTAFDKTPSLWSPIYSLVIGSGFEYESDSEQTEYGFPILIEYNFSERLKLTVEPECSYIVGKEPGVRTVGGFGDLETSLDYEFLRERRYRPALSVEGAIKWPTASDEDLGEPGHDYTLGLIASKDLIYVDLDLNLLYTFTGDHAREDEVEFSLAAGWRVTHEVELVTEVSTALPRGSLRRSGNHRGIEAEALLGLAWQASKRLKLEQGVVFNEQGVLQAVFAWEWSFGGD